MTKYSDLKVDRGNTSSVIVLIVQEISSGQ